MADSQIFDVKELASNLGMDDPDFLEDVWDIVNTYVEDTEQRLVQMENLISQEAHDSLRQEAHTLKGASASICAHQMYALAADLEQTAEQCQSERYSELTDSLKTSFEELKAEIVKQKL